MSYEETKKEFKAAVKEALSLATDSKAYLLAYQKVLQLADKLKAFEKGIASFHTQTGNYKNV
jgi:hypothetical protein